MNKGRIMTAENDNSSELNRSVGFDMPPEVLDEIRLNIEEIIATFPVPEDNKLDVIKKINFMYSHSRYLSLTDALTGLYNRRHLDTMLEREFLRAKRYGSDLSVAIIDIDFFKKVNDTYGHAVGDLVLKSIAKIIRGQLREYDIAGRYGGEEFSILLPFTKINEAQMVAERLRKTIENKVIDI